MKKIIFFIAFTIVALNNFAQQSYTYDDFFYYRHHLYLRTPSILLSAAGYKAAAGDTAEAISLMKVKHAVLTSVDRDELKDGGSIIWYNTIRAVKALNPHTTLETLIPDFKGQKENVQRVIDAAPEVVSHNIETCERLTRQVRIQAKYWRSMEVIRSLKEGGMRTKSGIMLGLGEKREEVIQTMKDLRDNGCDVITIGQYLQPTKKHLPVERFVHPDEFAEFREAGYEMGLDYVESGPLVRSSYHSERHVFPGLGRKEWEAAKQLVINL